MKKSDHKQFNCFWEIFLPQTKKKFKCWRRREYLAGHFTWQSSVSFHLNASTHKTVYTKKVPREEEINWRRWCFYWRKKRQELPWLKRINGEFHLSWVTEEDDAQKRSRKSSHREKNVGFFLLFKPKVHLIKQYTPSNNKKKYCKELREKKENSNIVEKWVIHTIGALQINSRTRANQHSNDFRKGKAPLLALSRENHFPICKVHESAQK